MWFNRTKNNLDISDQTSNDKVEVKNVPLPPTKPSTEVREALPRDDRQEIQATLNRLKGSQTNNSSEPQSVKTAGALITETEYQAGKKRRLLILGLGILIVSIIIGIFFIVLGLEGNRQIIRTGDTGVNFSGTEATIDTTNIIDTLNSINNQINDSRYFLSFKTSSPFNEDDVAARNSLIRQETLSALGFQFNPGLTGAITRRPLLQYSSTNNQAEFVFAFLISDLPNTTIGLRQWEPLAGQIDQALLTQSNGGFNAVQDFTYSNLDYRVINDRLAYTIDNADMVLIGTSPQLIERSRLELRSRLYQQ